MDGVDISYSRDLPEPGIEPVSLVSAALTRGFLMISATWEAVYFNMLKAQVEKVDNMYQHRISTELDTIRKNQVEI